MKQRRIMAWAIYVLTLLLWGSTTVLRTGTGYCHAQASEPAAAGAEGGFWQRLKTALNDQKQPDNTPNSVTERYGTVYDWIHSEEIQLYDSLSKLGVADWDRYQNIVSVRYDRADDTLLSNNLAPNIKVFGWHPYWMGGAYKTYRFNLLSYLAWFSYNIDSTGKNDNPDVIGAWKNAGELVDAAHAHNCKVLITITNHSRAGNTALLESDLLQEALIAHLLDLLKTGNGNGVDVNFEAVPPALKRRMTAFLKKLSEKLKGADNRHMLTVDLPAYDAQNVYELKELDRYVDMFVMTGYDYYGPNSKKDGPVAPLDTEAGGVYSIRHSVDQYLRSGLKREKLILALPYYGAVWTGKPKIAGQADPPLKFKEHITYRALRSKYRLEKPEYDLRQWSGYYEVIRRDSSFEKCWFDDSLTLGRKYDWILQEKLAGVGIWALGYDYGYPELWNLIAAKYAADTLLVYKDPYLETRYFRLSRSLAEYRSLIAVSGIFIVVFLMVGMVLALFDWRVRDVFFRNKTLRFLYAIGGIAILLCVYAFYLYASDRPLFDGNNLWALGVGLTLGVCLTFYINHRYEKSRKDLP